MPMSAALYIILDMQTSQSELNRSIAVEHRKGRVRAVARDKARAVYYRPHPPHLLLFSPSSSAMRTIEETRYFSHAVCQFLLLLTLTERDGTFCSPTTPRLPTSERRCNPSKEETCAMTD